MFRPTDTLSDLAGQGMEALLRSSVADYEVIEALTTTPSGCPRFRCRPPARLRRSHPVDVHELAVDANGWHQLADQLGRISALGSELLLELIELGPDLDPTGSGVYLVTEAAVGGNLEERAWGMSEGEILSCVARVADAVHSMHESGITHGCVDGRTVLFTNRGPVLGPPPLDFPEGMVTRFGGWRSMTAVDPDLLCGENATRSSDIWAIGATLHSVLSPNPLYRGIEHDESVTAVQRLLFSVPVVDSSLRPAVAEIISACLQPNPSNRPATAAEVAALIRAVGVSR